MSTLNVGVIGGGFGLKVQAPMINLHPSMKVTAVSTVNRHELPDDLKNEDVKPNHYTDWKEMLDTEDLDLVFISSMPVLHFEMAKYALEKGFNVVCEKPFTVDSSESEQLVELADRSGQKFLLDFEWRYMRARQKAKELLNEGRIGNLLHFEYHMSMAQYQRLATAKRGWLSQKSKAGGMLGALGSHLIDGMRWLTNSEVKDIAGLLPTHVPEGDGETRDADDGFLIHGVLENGSTFSIQFLSGINHGFGSMMKIFGTEGTIVLEKDEELRFGEANEPLETVQYESVGDVPSELSDVAKRYYEALYPYLEKVYEYIAEDKLDSDLPTIHDGHENQKVLDRIRKQ
ncbi:gfo/Idh/MocA family oxidoreductase [Halalkalibacillus sediminis]|uniref:Gfo/Idh/MocA family oxidoreductase n=1 Tax=Halalkalibacillus sediminis TaxID=2018042 RepID=A0A2I0QS00_9BACI|nr:Gfo/Idh/MocA family oxidoreductase [Halalkalibacillus sediminis]PKR76860.1 gfo/Idh/MocA family oxidoreductase [Halalkalibacillus sediminis]